MSAAEATSGAAVGASGAGLVPSKTTNPMISFAPSVVAERRVKRLKKSVWASGHLHGLADNGFRAPVCWFVTLTYRPCVEWAANHISAAIARYRKWAARKGLKVRYTWVAELQSRGAVHYHLLFWLPVGVRMPHWDRTYGGKTALWPYGMTNTQVAYSGVGYLMKYLSKLGELTRFPKGLRLYGIGGLIEAGRAVRSWLNLPEWVKAEHGVGQVKRQGGRLVVRSTGEILEPAYKVHRVPSGLVLCALREVLPRFHSGPYSSLSFSN